MSSLLRYNFIKRVLKNVINSLPNDILLNWSKLKTFADDKKCD